MRLSALLEMAELGLSPVTGHDELERTIRWVVTTDLLDPGRYLSGGELVLTGLVWRQSPADSERFVRSLVAAGVSALGAGDTRWGEIPEDLAEACRRHRMPLFHVPKELSFAEVTEHIVRRLSTARAYDMTAVLDRHRRLVAGATAGAGLDPVLHLLGHDLGMPCWVLTPAGRVVAGSHPLPEGIAPLLARGFLTAKRMPCTLRGVERSEAGRYSIFPVDEQTTPRVADWFLAFQGSYEDWPEERRALAGELAAVVALERARLDDRLSPKGRIAQELVQLVVSDGRPSDILPRLQVTGLVTDLGGERGFVAVAATSHDGLRPGELRVVVKEILNRSCASPVVGVAGEEVIALIPAPESDITAEVREAVRSLAPGLGSGRLTVGVSGIAPVDGLRGAVEEARYARRMAEGRAEPDAVVGHDELATHVLLLASVPDDVRHMFRVRLLDPLRGYDQVHRADLVRTLEAFLQVSGSWTKCAEILHVHVNTLRYRIQRIQDLTGRDLSRLEDRVDFFLALRLG
ncbi:PucR family transcriptional regulator ligand-binding domain-containing protein [Planomonospora sp. ID67723]|uniref:PucR family transcriptional regulator n=1 Tax=Planomonospora sp. ID67723 TaxID=2738134 RepID=UPI0018C3FF6A|nr:PucR family transcriptional regulator [Planomonospora sp. ID67723]MBG0829407.1 PucR family transcriptional regulator ligand-binding domain-containing protein [Planomonospora sp. ID67723]